MLPETPTNEWTSINEWTVGAAEACALQLHDPTGRVSRLHARLVHEWVRMHSAQSLPDIEKATLRLVAIRESRNLSSAASAARDGACLALALDWPAQAADARCTVTPLMQHRIEKYH